jgi:hypothetical protein
VRVADVSQFGKQAGVVFLLDQIMRVTQFETENEHNTQLQLAELTKLDSEVRKFLAALMEDAGQSYAFQTAKSTAIALSIR